jgi:hypothetical protein
VLLTVTALDVGCTVTAVGTLPVLSGRDELECFGSFGSLRDGSPPSVGASDNGLDLTIRKLYHATDG